MTHANPMIGKQGDYRPQLTVFGHPCPQAIPSAIGLGDGYYCVRETAVSGDWQAVVAQLRKEIKGSGKVRGSDGPKSNRDSR